MMAMKKKENDLEPSKEGSKVRTKRSFTSKDKKVEELYHLINEKINAAQLVNAFSYECVDGEHRLKISNQTLFIKKDNETKVECLKSLDGVFEKNKNVKYCFGSSDNTPVMWPIRKSTYGDTGYIEGKITRIIGQEVNAFLKNNPGFDKNADSKKALMQAELVLMKKWRGIHQRTFRMNARYAVKKWWLHFVDRDVLKSMISVSRDGLIEWSGYASFTQRPDLKDIQNHLSNMGCEKMLLADKPIDDWKNHTAQSLLPPRWFKHWVTVNNQPPSVQQTLLHKNIQYDLHINYDVSFSAAQPWAQAFNGPGKAVSPLYKQAQIEVEKQRQKDENQRRLQEKENEIDCLISLYENVRTQKNKWSPRELDMAMMAASGVTITHKEIPVVASYITTFIDVYRATFPKNFRSWGFHAQDHWRTISHHVLDKSIAKSEFTISDYSESGKLLKATYENALLTQNTKTTTTKAPSKRKM